MPHFLFQWKYRDPAIRAIVQTPQNRPSELRKAVEGFGGTLHQFYYAFGAHDGIAIVEFPDNESCAACSLMVAAAGNNATVSTTVLLTPEEGHRAMQKASGVETGYVPAIGYVR